MTPPEYDDLSLSEKQSLAAKRTTEIKAEKLQNEIQLYIRYKRRNGFKPTIKGTARTLQCSKNSVKKYWLSEDSYPVHDKPERGTKFNKHGFPEKIEDIGPLDDDSDFFTVREMRLPDFLSDEPSEPRKPIKKRKENNLKLADVPVKHQGYYKKALALVSRYQKNKKSEPYFKRNVTNPEKLALRQGRNEVNTYDVYLKALRDTISPHKNNAARVEEFRNSINWWLTEDSPHVADYRSEYTRVTTVQKMYSKCDVSVYFTVNFSINARNMKGEWLFRLQEAEWSNPHFDRTP